MRRRRLLGEESPTDALAGIVSAGLGTLVILSACFALLAALRSSQSAARSRRVAAHPRAEITLSVPWPKPSTKNLVFAALIGGRVQALDLAPVYERLQKRATPRRPRPVDVELPGVSIRFYPISNDAYCIRYRPKQPFGEAVKDARSPASAWQAARERFPADRFGFFFWVTPDSFEAFRELRDTLRRDNVEVDWKPVPAGAPLEICQGIEGGRGMEPQ
jgi:hypothetical protein